MRLIIGLVAVLAGCAFAAASVLAAGSPAGGPVGTGGRPQAPPRSALQPPPIGPSNVQAADALPVPPGTTERVSVTDAEKQANAVSGGVTALLAGANADQAISGDGRWVAFVSNASNLTPGGSTPGNLFLRDRQDGTTRAIPWINGVPFPAGVIAAEPAINADGSVVAFTVVITTTIRGIAVVGGEVRPYVLVWDRLTGVTELVSKDASGTAVPGFQPSISADGLYIAYTQWGPEATPPPTPTPLPNTAPSISNLTSSKACIDNGSGPSVISVNATDPDGDALTLGMSLYWTDGVGNTFYAFPPPTMSFAGGNTWTYTLSASEIASHGWSGYVHYAVTARDARGLDSATLRDNPFLDPQTNSVQYAPSGCTIL